MKHDSLTIAGRKFTSRLILGTGKYRSNDVMKASIIASGAEIVTTSVRRVDLESPQSDPFISAVNPDEYVFMINTSGARTAEEAIRIAKLAKLSGVSNWVKVEISPEPNHLMPDPIETLIACEQLVKEGFVVMPYIHADPVLAKRLEAVGCASVMPLGAPIGTNLGLETKTFIKLIIAQATIPVIIDAGLGAPSDAVSAMELGADAVLVNTAIATANDPIGMAEAFKSAVECGRKAFQSGLPDSRPYASASSPLTGFLRQ